MDISQRQVVIIQTVGLGLKAVIVVQPTIGPIQTAHLIYFMAQIGQHFAGHCPTHIGLGIECIARQVNQKVTLQDTHRIGIHNPFQGRFRGVNSRCIAQSDVQSGF